MDRFDDKSPNEALGVFHSRARCVWVHTAFSPGAASSWIAAASSLACSHPPPAPHVRVATPVLTSRTTTSSTPSPLTPDAVFTPVRDGRTGISTSGVSLFGFCLWVHLLVLLLRRWPLRGREKTLLLPKSLRRQAAQGEALDMFRSRIGRMWGHADIFAWSDLHLGSQPQARWLAVARRLRHARRGNSNPNCDYDFLHAQSLDTGRSVHARSWRANRDVDVRR